MLAFAENGRVDLAALDAAITDETACVLIQSPNFFGTIEDVAAIADIVAREGRAARRLHRRGRLARHRAPAREADIVSLEAQSFGVPLSYGGPYGGVIATREKFVRQMPGRLAGQTTDRNGKRGFVLTLSTREQHIRREKATSNICTNQALVALMATIFMSVYGHEGIRELAAQNLAKAAYARRHCRRKEQSCSSTARRASTNSSSQTDEAADTINAPPARRQDHRRPLASRVLSRARQRQPLVRHRTHHPRTDRSDREIARRQPQHPAHAGARIRNENGYNARNNRAGKHLHREPPEGHHAPLAERRPDLRALLAGQARPTACRRSTCPKSTPPTPRRCRCAPKRRALPEVSEIEIIRHFTRLSTWNYAIDLGMYPLGSCTMKYNPRVNEVVARLDGIAEAHPYQPEPLSQGALHIMKHARRSALIEITGMDAITLQPAAGAHGEFTGILLIRAYLESQGQSAQEGSHPRLRARHQSRHRRHGRLPGREPAHQPARHGRSRRSRSQMNEDIAALMLTNPNTLGIFESEIHKIADILHAKGGLLYMDGANMNALVGKARPGDFGVDVMHLNLHKTFSTPHGGGGPGSGPVACKKHPRALPAHARRRAKTPTARSRLDYDRPHSIGRVRAFYGNFGMFVRALAYIMANGPDGLRQTTEDAVLNANYMRKKLEGIYDLPYTTPIDARGRLQRQAQQARTASRPATSPSASSITASTPTRSASR